ncbi:MAG: FHA domain-containing protein, partial [Thermoanaerobaculia bacterium]|nr:FHA domain-containing protein [Thermoanaerobaculia bacterium]
MPSPPSPTQLIDLIVYEGSEEVSRIPWEGRRLLIGRRTSADIQIRDPTLSASHAEILEVDGRLCLRDLKSLNGTEINGARIGEAPLKPGDWVKLGEATLRVVERTTTSELELETAPQRDGPPSSETMRVSLDLLQEQRHQTLGEDRSIRLLSDLFEGLRSADDRRQILAEVRTSLGERSTARASSCSSATAAGTGSIPRSRRATTGRARPSPRRRWARTTRSCRPICPKTRVSQAPKASGSPGSKPSSPPRRAATAAPRSCSTSTGSGCRRSPKAICSCSGWPPTISRRCSRTPRASPSCGAPTRSFRRRRERLALFAAELEDRVRER